MEEEEEEAEKAEKVDKKEVTTIKEAVSKLNNEEIKKQLDPNNPVYWTAIWSDPRVRTIIISICISKIFKLYLLTRREMVKVSLQVRTLLNSASLGGSTVEGFTEEKDKLVKEVNNIFTHFLHFYPVFDPGGQVGGQQQ